jgi:hypothetical protein
VWFYKVAGNGYVLDPTDDGSQNETNPKDTGDLLAPTGQTTSEGLVTIINKSRSYAVTAATVNPGPVAFTVPITQGNSETIIVPASSAPYSITVTVNDTTAVPIQPSSFYVRELTSKIFYLYKSKRSGGPVITDTPEESDVNDNDLDPGGSYSDVNAEGEETDEDERLDLSTIPTLAAVRVNNLSNISIESVAFDGSRNNPVVTSYGMSTIRGKHNRSIILKAEPVSYIVTIRFIGVTDTYPGYSANARTTTLTFRAYGTSKKINDIYFYLGKDGNYHVNPSRDPRDPYNDFGDGPPPDHKIDDGTTTTPPSGDGEGGNPADYPSFNKDLLGVLIVRNLTSIEPKARSLTKVEFFRGSYSSAPTTPVDGEYFKWDPAALGPGNDRPILLRSGQWTIVMYWVKKDTPPADNASDISPKLKVKTIVQASLTPVNYCYFYIDTLGNHSIWTGNDFPADYDPASNNITTPDVGHGTIRINNQSQVGSRIQEAEWMGLPYDNVDIPANNSGDINDAPIGTSSIRFRISGKTEFGSPMTITVRENQTTTVNYTDSMEESVLQPGYSQLRLFNNTGTSGATITKIRIVNRGMTSTAAGGTMIGDNGVIENTAFEPIPGPITSGETKSILIKNGESTANPNYVVMVTVQKSARTFIVERPVYLNNSIATIELTALDVADDSDKNVEKPDPEGKGGIRVYNSYARRYTDAGVVLIPEFKIYQYKLIPKVPQIPPIIPSPEARTWPNNGVSPQTDPAAAPIYVGGSGVIPKVNPGIYTLQVIAGTYPWHMYWGSDPAQTGNPPGDWPKTSNNIPLTVGLITYDCNEIWIVEGFESQYHFSPTEQERDTPNGFVIFYVSNTAQADSRAVSYVEIVKPDIMPWNGSALTSPLAGKNLWDLKGTNTAAAYHLQFPSTGALQSWPYNRPTSGGYPANKADAFRGWDNKRSAPKRNIVFSYGQTIERGHSSGPFIIPAGEYWCRYMDNHSAGNTYGRNATQWRYVNLTDNAGQIAYATLDNTTYFTWKGEEIDYDETIDPVTGLPYVNPVLDLDVSSEDNEATLRIKWNRPSPSTNLYGATVRIYKAEEVAGEQVLVQLGDSELSGTLTTVASTGTNTVIKTSTSVGTGATVPSQADKDRNGPAWIQNVGTTATVSFKIGSMEPGNYTIVVEAMTSKSFTYGRKYSSQEIYSITLDP